MKPETKRKELVRAEVLKRAAVLFAEKGFAATNKQHIADSVGIGRTSLYYYFKNKDQILEALVEDVTIYTAKLIKRHRLLNRDDPAAQLRGAVTEMMARILEAPVLFKVLDRNESELPDVVSKTHVEAKRSVAREISAIIAQGVESGTFREVDPRIAAYTIIGMVTWSAWWYNAETGPAANIVAEQVAEMAVLSITPRQPQNGTRTVAGALDDIRDQLAFIQAQIPGK